MTSLYETNILNQPSTWKQLLNSSIPIELIDLQANRIVFIGIGSSFWIARIAEFLWREYNIKTTITPCSVQSFDLVKSKYVISDNDIVVVLSHRGTKTFSVKALELAKNNGATTILITGIGSPQMTSNRVD